VATADSDCPRGRGSVLEDDLDRDVVRDLDAHQLAERAFVGVDVDETLVDAHLPVLPRRGPLAVGGLSGGNLERLGRQRHRTGQLHAGLARDVSDLATDRVEVFGAGARQPDACLLHELLALVDAEDATGRDRLAHVADGEAPEFRDLARRLDAERLLRPDRYDGGVAVLDEVRVLLFDLPGGRVDFLVQRLDRTGDLCGVSVEDRRVAGRDDARVLHDDDLGLERLGDRRRVVGGATDVTAADVVLADAADVEPDVVTGARARDFLVVHLDGLDLAAHVAGLEDHVVAGVHRPGLDAADGHGPDAGDGVDVLDRQAQRGVRRRLRLGQRVERLEQSLTVVPARIVGGFGDVVALERGERDELRVVRVELDLLEQLGDLFDDFLEATFLVVDEVHLVDTDDHLADAEGASQEDVLLGLGLNAVVGGDNEDSVVSLGRARDHVLDEVAVARTVDDGEEVIVGVELLVGDVDGDTALALLGEVVHDVGELEAALALLLGLFFVLFDDVLGYAPRLVEEAPDQCALPVVDVTDNSQVLVWLVFAHCCISRAEALCGNLSAVGVKTISIATVRYPDAVLRFATR